jgi:hypothetical protein
MTVFEYLFFSTQFSPQAVVSPPVEADLAWGKYACVDVHNDSQTRI